MASIGVGLYGYLKYRAPAGGWVTYDIVRRNDGLDDVLRKAGYDPEDINRADTPLVGAEGFATIRVLCRAWQGDGILNWGVPYDDSDNVPSEAGLYDVVLAEPNAEIAETNAVNWLDGSTFQNIIRGTLSEPVEFPQYLPEDAAAPQNAFSGARRIPPTMAGDAEVLPTDPTVPPVAATSPAPVSEPTRALTRTSDDLVKEGAVLKPGDSSQLKPTPINDPLRPRSRAQAAAAGPSGGGGEGGGGTDPGDGPPGDGGGTDDPDYGGTMPVGLSGDSRFLHWSNLHIRSLRELRRSAANSVRPDGDGQNGRPDPTGEEDTLYVVELVDSRWRLGLNFDVAVNNANLVGYTAEQGSIHGEDSGSGEIIYGGCTQSAFNMLADVPIQFEASTVYKTRICRRAMSVLQAPPKADRSPTLDSAAEIDSIAATAPTYIQQPFTLWDLLAMFQNTLNALVGDTVYLELAALNASLDSMGEFDAPLLEDGDIINLDFAGMTVGQALDFLAKRLGGCWLWERSANALVFAFVDGPTDSMWLEQYRDSADQSAARSAVPDVGNWLWNNSRFRTMGHINTVAELVPMRVSVNHETRYCARIGPNAYTQGTQTGDAGGDFAVVFGSKFGDKYPPKQGKYRTLLHYVDCRTGETLDGTVSTSFITGLGSRHSAMNHERDSGEIDRARAVYITIQDHIPALVGTNTGTEVPQQLPGVFTPSDNTLHRDFRYGLGTSRMALDLSVSKNRVPWNYDHRTFRTATFYSSLFDSPWQWGDIVEGIGTEGEYGTEAGTFLVSTSQFDTSLSRRRKIYESRMAMLRRVVDGDATYNRLPEVTGIADPAADGAWCYSGFITPSVGLQNETIHFGGHDRAAVRYRIWGSRWDSRIMPHGAKIASAATAGAALVPTSGAPTVRVRQKSPGTILRSFLCRFDWYKEISTKDAKQFKIGTNPQPYPFIWLYKFVEVVPDNNPETMLFAQNDYLGWQTNAIGYALNICEMNYRDAVTTDDTTTAYAPEAGWDGSILSWNHGEEGYAPVVQLTPPQGYTICYEVANRLGFSSYYIMAPNGHEVICGKVAPSAFAPVVPFLYMGGSGVGKPQPDQTISNAILQA